MKKMLIFATTFLAFGSAIAQDKYFFAALDIQKPLSNTSSIGEISTRGLKVGYRSFINERFSAGIEISSNAFDQYHPMETIVNPTGALTTDYFKYVYSYSAALTGQYYFGLDDRQKLFPYAGLGLGANRNEYVTYYNIYSDEDANWGFLARPEAGVIYRLFENRSISVMAAVNYTYSTNRSEIFDYSSFNALGFQLGLVLME